MRWVRDRTGRFRWRPWYEPHEIDALCERRIVRFLHARYGEVAYPISTDDLTRLIEQDAGHLDLYATLAGQGPRGREIEGVTRFYRDQRPRVEIDRALSLNARRQARLRTTLAHELGHVLLHDFARRHATGDSAVPARLDVAQPAACAPGMGHARSVDWMEWQAYYACGALLMPRSAVQALVASLPIEARHIGPLVDRLQTQFLVSEAAAFVRLRHLGSAGAGHGMPPAGDNA